MQNTTEKTPETKAEKGAMTVYELSYLFLPSLSSEDVSTEVASIKSLVTSLGGGIISEEHPVLIDLAYKMTKVVQTIRHKADTGYFGWVKFDLPQGEITQVKKACDANTVVLRYLIIKTVRENTLLTGKMTVRRDERNKKEEGFDEEVVAEQETASPEEVDKSIDDLVIA